MNAPTRSQNQRLVAAKLVFETVHRRLPLVLSAAGIGGLGFVWVQALTGTKNIAAFVGRRIVETGDYSAALESPIGWTVHLTIAVQYALAFAVLLALPVWPRGGVRRYATQAVAAVAVGFVATWIANPAISVTVSLLGGAGWPETLYPVNTSLGVPLYNHLAFFTLTLVWVEWLPASVRGWVDRRNVVAAGRPAVRRGAFDWNLGSLHDASVV